MSKLTESYRSLGIHNPYNFAAGTVFIVYSSISGRGHTFQGYNVIKEGLDLGTHWTDHGSKTFDLYHYRGSLKESRAAALAAAMEWASEKFGIDEWAKTPYNSYGPKSFVEGRKAELAKLLSEMPPEASVSP